MSESFGWSHDQRKLIPARIVEVGGDADEVGVPHAWRQLVIDPDTGEYIDHLTGLAGTISFNSAYSLDGGPVSAGTVVMVRCRGWSYKKGVIFDIVGSSRDSCYGAGDGGGSGGGGGGRGDCQRFPGCYHRYYSIVGPVPVRSASWVFGGIFLSHVKIYCEVASISILTNSGSTVNFLTKEEYNRGVIVLEPCGDNVLVHQAHIVGPHDWGEPAPLSSFIGPPPPDYCGVRDQNCWPGGSQDAVFDYCRDEAIRKCWPDDSLLCLCANYADCLNRSLPRGYPFSFGNLIPECLGNSFYFWNDPRYSPFFPRHGGGSGGSGGNFSPSGHLGSSPSYMFSGGTSFSGGGYSFQVPSFGRLGPVYSGVFESLVNPDYYDMSSSSSGGGWWSYGSVSGTLFSTPIHDYSPGSAKFLLLQTDSGGPKTITGLSMGQVDGQEVCIKNTSPMDNIVLQWESSGSLAANRFANPPSSGSDTILPGGRVVYKYTTHLNRWVKVV